MTKLTVVTQQTYDTSFSLDVHRVYTGHMDELSRQHQLDTRVGSDGDILTIEHHNLYSDVSETMLTFTYVREAGVWELKHTSV